jgi:hypothetical protein
MMGDVEDNMNKTQRIAITDAYVTEGHLYAPKHSEDGTLLVCDFGVGADGADGKVYRHVSYKVKGYVVDEVDGFSQVDWQAEGRAKAFAAKVKAAGSIDPAHWYEVEPFDLQADLAAEAERERLDRQNGCGDFFR